MGTQGHEPHRVLRKVQHHDEAGYGPGRPLAEQFKIEWFTQTLPLPLATSVRSVIFANQSDRVQLNAQLAALGKEPLPDYEATLTAMQALAVNHRTEYEIHGLRTNKTEQKKRPAEPSGPASASRSTR